MPLTIQIDDDGIAIVRFDNDRGRPNILTRDDIEALEQGLDPLINPVERGVKGVIVTGGEESGFLAGVDVSAIADLAGSGEREKVLGICDFAQRVFDRLRVIPVPTIAVINGTALGGGLELALSCKYRIVADDRSIRLGLPEVNLGIIPGFSGTQRLVRLIGLKKAIEVASSGKRLLPKQALRYGIVDEVVPRPLLLDVAKQVIADWNTAKTKAYLRERVQPQSWGERLTESFLGRVAVSWLATRSIRKATGGHYPAPVRCVSVMHHGLIAGPDAGMRMEREAVADLLTQKPPLSPAKHLLDIFHLREGHRRDYPGRLEKQSSEARRWTLPQQVGVVGAGLMGGGIAQLAAHEGIDVRMRDVMPEALASAMSTIDGLVKPLVKKRRLAKHEAMAEVDRVMPTLDYSGFERCDFVVEAVVERIDIKRQVFRELEEVVRPDAILATNTSSLPITQIAEGLEHPERVVGLHFFSPVHRMPLVEIIPGAQTSAATVEQVFRLAVKLGKIPVICQDQPGFLVNRVLGAYLNEAAFCLYDGVPAGRLDKVMREFGMPMGPCELIDQVGLRVAVEVATILRNQWPTNFPNPFVSEELLTAGAEGRRSHSGFYRYGKWPVLGWKRKTVSPLLKGVLKDLRSKAGQEGGPPKPAPAPANDQVVDRLMAAMINEAWRALDDGVVKSPDDVDAAMVFGTGFPPFRGGPMRYAESIGHKQMLERLKRLRDECGPRFEPAPVPH